MFTLNNVSWTLYLCSDLHTFQQLFPCGSAHRNRFISILADKIVVDSHRQAILTKKKIVQHCICYGPGHSLWTRTLLRGYPPRYPPQQLYINKSHVTSARMGEADPADGSRWMACAVQSVYDRHHLYKALITVIPPIGSMELIALGLTQWHAAWGL